MKGEAGEKVLGRYRLEHPVGEGGFGCVWRGRQLALDRPVAVKATRAARKDDPATAERFRREALLVAGIAHPNVVTYHDFGIDADGDRILVMELLEGLSLLDVLRRGRPVPLADVVRWTGQAAAGLAEAHARGLVHRDVKPSNLFLVAPGTRAERLKVIDFGIVRADPRAHPDLQRLTRTDAVIGTPEYIAPEALAGSPLDGRADQYALALVAFELIAMKRPFPPAAEGGLVDRLAGRPEGLDFAGTGRRVPPAVSAALARALSPSPADRFPTVLAFADALREAAAGLEEGGHGDRTRVAAVPEEAATRTAATRAGAEGAREAPGGRGGGTVEATGPRAPGGRRRPWALALAAVVAVALGAGAAWALRPGTLPLAGGTAGGAEAGAEGAAGEGMEAEAARVEVPKAAGEEAVPAAAVPGASEGPAAAAGLPAAASVATAPGASAMARTVPGEAGAGGAASRIGAGGAPGAAPRSARDAGPRPARGVDPRPSGEDARAQAAPHVPARGEGAGGPVEPATLVLNAVPWADVEVDGRAAGRTPLKGVQVQPGRHRVRFVHPRLGEEVVEVEVGAGEVRRLPAAFRGISPGAGP